MGFRESKVNCKEETRDSRENHCGDTRESRQNHSREIRNFLEYHKGKTTDIYKRKNKEGLLNTTEKKPDYS